MRTVLQKPARHSVLRRWSTGLGLCLAAGTLALGPAATQAAPAEPPTGPTSLATGFTDYNFVGANAEMFTLAARAGARWIRFSADWQTIAPFYRPRHFDAADPSARGYDWRSLDQAVRLAGAHHLIVLLQIGQAPIWAEGLHPPASVQYGSWKPNPQALGAFAHALAVRYSGHYPDPLRTGQNLPAVSHFQIWNEPNLALYLAPQWARNARGGFSAASPDIYRNMLNAAYTQIKTVQPRAEVLSAGTAPYGDPPGQSRMRPVTFMEDLFCLHGARLTASRCPAVHLDALDTHPYSSSPTQRSATPGDVAIDNISELEHIAAVAGRDHHILPAGPKPYWVTEISWGSIPPETSHGAFAVPLATQARNLSLAFYEFWRQHVSHVFWFLLRDDPQTQYFSGSGVYFQNGAAKPAQLAFRFPFVVVGAGHDRVQIWGRAPSPGRVEIERLIGRHWSRFTQMTTSHGGIFVANATLGSAALLRAVTKTSTSLPFSVR